MRSTPIAILAAALCLPFSQAAQAERAFDLLKQPRFRAAYHSALGPLKSEKWIANLVGPASETFTEAIDGAEYVLADSCKPHDCAEENLVLAYSRSSSKVYILVQTGGKLHTLGGPSPAAAAALERFHSMRFKR